MGRVIFSIRYDIIPERREEYLNVIRELKTLVKTEGLESYSAFEQKNRKNSFEEVYIFSSQKDYEDFDDNQDERVDILMTKLSDMIKQQSTQYSTLYEVEG
ncbi:MAG: hypothetical protein A2V66_14260 [Ignavibacteria bacterium RBG_13_36_8]|nr:MAG: hypothetical protein A2V66_14260 [Ignavibacteria bacterium RBG_13_36_8]